MKSPLQLMTVICLVTCSNRTIAQTGNISGTILTNDKQPAMGVNVSVKGTTSIHATKEDGTFFFSKIKDGRYTLVVSFSGVQTQEKNIKVIIDQTAQVNFILQENANELDDVTVKATRSPNLKTVALSKAPIAIMDLPQSVTSISEATIKEQQALRLSDVIKNVNGVYLADLRAGNSEIFFARGYSLGANNMFKNGVRVNTGAMPEISSLERVEFLKGSAAILYGNVAPGGIVNMVTRQPKFRFGGEVTIRTGSFDLYKPSVDIYGPISHSIAYRVNSSYETANSYRDAVSNKRIYVNPSLLFKAGKKTEILVQADYLVHDYTPDFGLGTLDNSIIPNLPRNTFLGTNWQYATSKQRTATVQEKHQFNENWSLNSSASYQYFDRQYYAVERILAAANGDWTRPLNKTETIENYYNAQVNLVGKFNTDKLEHTLLTGIDGDRYIASSVAFNNSTTYDIINILDPNKFVARTDIPEAAAIRKATTPSNRAGVYVQDLIGLSDKLKLLVGIRWSYQEALQIDSLNLLTNARTKSATSKIDRAFSPRFGLVYKPVATTSFFVSYANSFSVNTGTDVNGGILAPSLIDQYEVGVKNDFFKGMLSANLTVYKIVNNNLAQTAQFLADDVTLNSNTALKALNGQTTSDGGELDISAHPVKGLNIMAGYSYVYMRYTKTPDTKTSYVTGERLVSNPSSTANGSAFYTISNGALKGLKMGLGAYYVGKRFGGYNNTKGQTQTYDRLIPVSSFTTVDLSLGYTYKTFALIVKLSNVGNTFNYYVHENYSINPIAPRQFGATLGYKF
ncbi:MAG: TonB-dependent receptor [Chitinophagaceae bacterium]